MKRALRIPTFFKNPVALKEMRQAVRSRALSVGLALYLGLLLVVCLTVASGDPEPTWLGELGYRVFAAGRGLLLFMTGLFVPLLTGMRAVQETDAARRDVLFTTTLPPGRFVDGKAFSALAVAALGAFAALPFLVLAYLLRGLSPGEVAVSVAVCLLWSVLASLLALVVGALPAPKPARMVLLLLGAGIGSIFLLGAGADLDDVLEWLDLDDLHWVEALAIWAGTALLLRGAAMLEYAPPHMNRARPLLRTTFAVALAALAVRWIDTEATVAGLVPLLALFVYAGACCARGGCSRRVLAEGSRRPLLRFLQFPFFTGAECGMAHAALLAALWIAGAAAWTLLPPDLLPRGFTPLYADAKELGARAAFWAYLFAYVGTARLLWVAALRRTRVPPVAVPFIAIAALVAVSVFAAVRDAAGGPSPESVPGFPWGLGDGDYALGRMADRGELEPHIRTALSWAGVVALLHVLPVIRALGTFLRARPRSA